MATRAGKAVVDFEGNFGKLQTGAASAVSSISGSITSKIGGAFGGLARSAVGVFDTVATTAGIAFDTLAAGIAAGAGRAAMASLRVDELNTTLTVLGRVNKVAQPTIDATVAAVKGMGIETAVAQGTVAQFIRSHLDLAKASGLARVAQDAAVISGQNSTETLQQLIDGVMTLQPEILRSAGIYVDAAGAEALYAKQHGKTAASLTTMEKQQALLNAVIASGTTIQGAYLAALADPSKQLRTIPRLINDIEVQVGKGLSPVLGTAISTVFTLAGTFDKLTQPGTVLYNTFVRLGNAGAKALTPLVTQVERFEGWLAKLTPGQVDQVFGTIQKYAGPIAGLAAALGTLGASKLPFVGEFVKLNPLIAGIVALVAATPGLRTFIGQLATGLLPVLGTVASTVSSTLRDIAPVLQPVIAILAGAFTTAVLTLTPVLNGVISSLGPLVRELLPPAARLLGALALAFGDVVAAAAPVAISIGRALAGAFVSLEPVLEDLVGLVDQVLVAVITNLGPVLAGAIPVLARFVGAVVPPLLQFFGWVVSHGWVVDAVLAAIVGRFLAMKAIDLAAWALGAGRALTGLLSGGAGAAGGGLLSAILPNVASLRAATSTVGEQAAAGIAAGMATAHAPVREAAKQLALDFTSAIQPELNFGLGGIATSAAKTAGGMRGAFAFLAKPLPMAGLVALGAAIVVLASDAGGLRTSLKNAIWGKDQAEVAQEAVRSIRGIHTQLIAALSGSDVATAADQGIRPMLDQLATSFGDAGNVAGQHFVEAMTPSLVDAVANGQVTIEQAGTMIAGWAGSTMPAAAAAIRSVIDQAEFAAEQAAERRVIDAQINLNNLRSSAAADFASVAQGIESQVQGIMQAYGLSAQDALNWLAQHDSKVQGLMGRYTELNAKYGLSWAAFESMASQTITVTDSMGTHTESLLDKWVNDKAAGEQAAMLQRLRDMAGATDWATSSTDEWKAAMYRLRDAINATHLAYADLNPGANVTQGGHRMAGGGIIAGADYTTSERGSERFVSATNGYMLNHSTALGLAMRRDSALVDAVVAQLGDGSPRGGNQFNVTIVPKQVVMRERDLTAALRRLELRLA